MSNIRKIAMKDIKEALSNMELSKKEFIMFNDRFQVIYGNMDGLPTVVELKDPVFDLIKQMIIPEDKNVDKESNVETTKIFGIEVIQCKESKE